MGLSQIIKFDYVNKVEVERFFTGVFEDQKISKENELISISSKFNKDYLIEIAIEDYGLYIHRSGKYFELLGILIEALTGRFGKITIEDN